MSFVPINPFFSAKLRLRRANQHLTQFISEDKAFFTDNPGGYVCELDPDSAHHIHKIKFTKRFPASWSVLATEIVEHLRAALDHATFATFRAEHGVLADSNFAVFPFGRTPADVENSVRGRSKDLRKEIQSVLVGLEPYKGGNDALYALNELSNISKHSFIT